MNQPDHYDLIIIGAGIGGIISLKYARDAGLRAIVLEKASQIGGLWRDLPAWQDIQIAKQDWTLAGLPLDGEDQSCILANIRSWVTRYQPEDGIRLNCAATGAIPINDPAVCRHRASGRAQWQQVRSALAHCVPVVSAADLCGMGGNDYPALTLGQGLLATAAE